MNHQNVSVERFLLGFKMLHSLESGRIGKLVILLKVLTLIFFFRSTFSCLSVRGGNAENLHRTYFNVAVLFDILFLQAVRFIYRSQSRELAERLSEPWDQFEPNTKHWQLVKEFDKLITRSIKTLSGVFAITALGFIFVVPFLWFESDTNEIGDCVNLPFGSVELSNSFWYNLLIRVYSSCTFVIMVGDLCVESSLLMLAILKTQVDAKLISADLSEMNNILNWPEETDESRNSSGKTIYWEQESTLRTAPGPSKAGVDGEIKNVLAKGEADGKDQGLMLKEFSKINQRILERKIRMFTARIVERHIRMKQLIWLADKVFRHQFLILLQVASLWIGFSMHLGKSALISGKSPFFFEIFNYFVVSGLSCHAGQILIDESETLRQALYSCDWTDKPPSLRRNLLIMQTVAMRPLRLTGRGVFSLDLETFTAVASATYSYISISVIRYLY